MAEGIPRPWEAKVLHGRAGDSLQPCFTKPLWPVGDLHLSRYSMKGLELVEDFHGSRRKGREGRNIREKALNPDHVPHSVPSVASLKGMRVNCSGHGREQRCRE